MARYFKVTHPDGTLSFRSSENRVYTHAIVFKTNDTPPRYSTTSFSSKHHLALREASRRQSEIGSYSVAECVEVPRPKRVTFSVTMPEGKVEKITQYAGELEPTVAIAAKYAGFYLIPGRSWFSQRSVAEANIARMKTWDGKDRYEDIVILDVKKHG